MIEFVKGCMWLTVQVAIGGAAISVCTFLAVCVVAFIGSFFRGKGGVF